MGNSTSDDHYYLTSTGKATVAARNLIKEKLVEDGQAAEDDVLEEHVQVVERSMALVNKHFLGSRTSADTLDRVRYSKWIEIYD